MPIVCNIQARNQDLTRGGAIWRAACENFFGGILMIFKTMFCLDLQWEQWYMVVFNTLSMHTIKANLFNKCIWAFKGVLLNITESSNHLLLWLCNMKMNDLISYSFKKKLFKGQGVLWKRLTTEMPQKNRLIKQSTLVKGRGAKSLNVYRRLPFHFHGTMHIINKSYCFN